MYLTKRIYVGGEYHNVTASNNKTTSGSATTYLTIDDNRYTINWKKVGSVIEEAMYWRKANAIHAWFVKNVQDGVDDCKEYWVPFDKLVELKSIVCKILKNHDLAEKLLPTQSGFFFGGTDYDQYYFDDLENTKDNLSKIIKEYKQLTPAQQLNVSFYYESSW